MEDKNLQEKVIWFDLYCSGKMISSYSVEESMLESVDAEGIIKYIYNHIAEFVRGAQCFTRSITHMLDICKVPFAAPCIYICNSANGVYEYIHVSNIRRYL